MPASPAAAFDKMASLLGLDEEDFNDFFGRLEDLSPAEIAGVLGYLLGRLDPRDAAAMVSVVRRLHPQRRVMIDDNRATVNIVGTGGGPATFNITTTAAFVVAAAGPVVVKTGSAASRSRSGFADVAMKLGTLKVAMPWQRIEAIANEVGIVFIPESHYAAVLGPLHKRLTRAIHRNVAGYLNKIGPLLSPVRVDHAFIGANSIACLEMLADTCCLLGDLPTTLLAAADGMDEVSTLAESTIIELRADRGRVQSRIDPTALGIERPALEELAGHEPAAAAECCERILSGRGTRPQNEIVALNAGVVLVSLGVCADWRAGFETATDILRQGEGYHKLRQLRDQVWQCVKL